MEIMFLIKLLVLLAVICVVAWAARTIIAASGVGQPFAALLWVAVVIILMLVVLAAVGGLPSGGRLRLS